MKNKLSNLILIIIILLLSLFIVFFSINYLNTDKKVVKSGKEIKQSSSNSLALMLETAISSGEYQVSTDSTWPATGYDFNPTLSKCENGSTLTYDIITKKVKVQSNRSDKCFVYFDKETLPVINSIIESNVTMNAFTVTVNATAGTKPIKTYYYSKDNGTSYVTSSSNSYTFSGLLEGNSYNIKVKVEDIGSKYSEIFGKIVRTAKDIFVEYFKKNYSTLGMDYHNGLANGANDGSYRFSGANPNNYVCFGPGATTEETACSEDNQYRIIGVFGNQVKLIKKNSVGNKVWNQSYINNWAGSIMNTYLNGEYMTNLTSTWNNKIASSSWQVGGMSDVDGWAVPATAYNYEVGPNKANVIFNGKIGLMYVSDYGFAASPGSWTTGLTSYDSQIANNWLFAGNIHSDEWTMSRTTSSNLPFVFAVTSSGGLCIGNLTNSWAVRPSFSLKSSVNLIGGNGTVLDPYRIS